MKNCKHIYSGIDFLRTVACLGIVLMHIKANSNYNISGWFYNTFIMSLTDFVYLFMAISAFGMCCGYFDKVMSGTIDWTEFYKKRYAKILPFFGLLILLDVIMNFSKSSLFEGILEITLLHGFVPVELSVIGVGWYLGTVFVFYIIFPFFCVLIENKRRCWISFIISLILHYICVYNFGLDRHNIIFSLCYFLAGGIIYLYRERLAQVKPYIYFFAMIFTFWVYYCFNTYGMTVILLVSILLSFAISWDLKNIKIVSFISDISMEIYLSHMFVFRICEFLHLNNIFGNGVLQYSITSVFVILGTILLSYYSQKVINIILNKVMKVG